MSTVHHLRVDLVHKKVSGQVSAESLKNHSTQCVAWFRIMPFHVHLFNMESNLDVFTTAGNFLTLWIREEACLICMLSLIASCSVCTYTHTYTAHLMNSGEFWGYFNRIIILQLQFLFQLKKFLYHSRSLKALGHYHYLQSLF